MVQTRPETRKLRQQGRLTFREDTLKRTNREEQ